MEDALAGFELQLVLLLHVPLVDTATCVALTQFAFARGEEDVNSPHLPSFKLGVFNSSFRGWLHQDALIAIDDVLLESVRKDSITGCSTICSGNLLQQGRNVVVLLLRDHASSSCLDHQLRSMDKVSNSSFYGRLFSLDHNSVSHNSRVSVNLNTKVNSHNIAFLQRFLFFGIRRVMASDLIHADACRESHSSAHLGFVLEVSLCQLTNFIISKFTKLCRSLPGLNLIAHQAENLVSDLGRKTIFF